jgi:PleD family two-component response regulator
MLVDVEPRAAATSEGAWRPFVVLLVGQADARRRSLSHELESTGYEVLHTDTAEHAIDVAHSGRPDAVIISDSLEAMTPVELCRRLTGSPRFNAATPVIMTSIGTLTRADRIEAFSAGVWAMCAEPVDGALFLLKLQTYIRARYVGRRLREASVYDNTAGLYTFDGLLLRARELGAVAMRRREALACIAIIPADASERQSTSQDSEKMQRVAAAFRRTIRGSDVIGRLGSAALGVIAPATTESGAYELLRRVSASLNEPGDPLAAASRIEHSSISATADLRSSPVGAVEMLLQAVSGLQRAP